MASDRVITFQVVRWLLVGMIAFAPGCDVVFGIEPRACETSNPGYVKVPGLSRDSRYRFEAVATATWRVAEATCAADKAHLFVPDTLDELVAMYAAMPNFSILNDAWIGVAHDAPAGEFAFVTGALVPTFVWAPQQPIPGPGIDVGVLVRNVGVNVDPQANANDFICECDGEATREFAF